MEDRSTPEEKLSELLDAGGGPRTARFALAILGGLIPFAGGAVGGAAADWAERDQERVNHILRAWLKLQEDEIREIGITVVEVMARLDLQDEKVRERLESPEYLKIVKKCFREWSAAESEEKRVLIRNLLTNAAASDIASDDVVRMFVSWIDRYSEAHFKVVAAVYNNDGLTRLEIWARMGREPVREDSADADLFKLLIQELTMGHVMRQHREVDYMGNFIKAKPRPRGTANSSRYTSAFEDDREYELTELGQQFVHYTMNELAPRISSSASPSASEESADDQVAA